MGSQDMRRSRCGDPGAVAVAGTGRIHSGGELSGDRRGGRFHEAGSPAHLRHLPPEVLGVQELRGRGRHAESSPRPRRRCDRNLHHDLSGRRRELHGHRRSDRQISDKGREAAGRLRRPDDGLLPDAEAEGGRVRAVLRRRHVRQAGRSGDSGDPSVRHRQEVEGQRLWAHWLGDSRSGGLTRVRRTADHGAYRRIRGHGRRPSQVHPPRGQMPHGGRYGIHVGQSEEEAGVREEGGHTPVHVPSEKRPRRRSLRPGHHGERGQPPPVDGLRGLHPGLGPQGREGARGQAPGRDNQRQLMALGPGDTPQGLGEDKGIRLPGVALGNARGHLRGLERGMGRASRERSRHRRRHADTGADKREHLRGIPARPRKVRRLRLPRPRARSAPSVPGLLQMAQAQIRSRCRHPRGNPRDSGMAPGKERRIVQRLLPGRHAGLSSGHLSVHHRQPRRGDAGQAQGICRCRHPYGACHDQGGDL